MAVDGAPKILLVDDEQNILSSLKRVLRREGYDIYTAQSGPLGLEILDQQEMDLIISDMRMPEMMGSEFLAKAYQKYPDTVRILLTGFADITSTIEAINIGKIYCYIGKPWDDEDIKSVVRQALDSRMIKKERDRLLIVTERQNQELLDLNQSLEAKVRERTQELSGALSVLKSSFKNTILVLSNIVDMIEACYSGASRDIADTAKDFAAFLKHPEINLEELYYSGLLNKLGRITLPSQLRKKPYMALSKSDLELFKKHPLNSEAILLPLDNMQAVANILAAACESYAGDGFPKKLQGDAIPITAQCLKLACDYYDLQEGLYLEAKFTPQDALTYLQTKLHHHYEPKLLAKFVKFIEDAGFDEFSHASEIEVGAKDLSQGMVLTRDIFADGNILLLAKDTVMNERLIDRIWDYDKRFEQPIKIFVKG